MVKDLHPPYNFQMRAVRHEVQAMLLELAKPASLLLCILSMLGVFRSAFLGPAIEVQDRLAHSLELLTLAAAISLVSGLLFRAGDEERSAPQKREDLLIRTLPVQFFCWALGIMVLLFAVSWYLESHPMGARNLKL